MTGGLTRRAVLCRSGGLAWCGMGAAAQAATGRRVVSMDFALTETMLMLGVPPIAMPDCAGWTRWVVEPDLPASVLDLGSSYQVSLELLASLKPDLILTTPYLDSVNPTLARIAPCERLSLYETGGAGPLERAKAVTRHLGTLLGIPERADAALAEARAQFAENRHRLAALPKAPLLLVNFMDARHVRVYGDKSLWQDVLTRLDRPNAWRGATTFWGFATVGIEELATVPPDTTLVSFAPVPADAEATLSRSRLWRRLPFVQGGRVIDLPPALMFGAVPSAQRFSRLLTDRLLKPAP